MVFQNIVVSLLLGDVNTPLRLESRQFSNHHPPWSFVAHPKPLRSSSLAENGIPRCLESASPALPKIFIQANGDLEVA